MGPLQQLNQECHSLTPCNEEAISSRAQHRPYERMAHCTDETPITGHQCTSTTHRSWCSFGHGDSTCCHMEQLFKVAMAYFMDRCGACLEERGDLRWRGTLPMLGQSTQAVESVHSFVWRGAARSASAENTHAIYLVSNVRVRVTV